MKKVKVTREIADAIEFAVNHNFRHTLIDAYMKVKGASFSEKLSVLYKISYDDFFKVLYIGYEVEPEFKVGDWVKVTFKLHGSYNSIRQITKVKPSMAVGHHVCYELDGQGSYYDEEFCHATPSEIAEEKERRWWKNHGREVRELHVGDIVYSYSTGLKFVKNEAEHIISKLTNFDGFRVVCFAENRLDREQEND